MSDVIFSGLRSSSMWFSLLAATPSMIMWSEGSVSVLW